VIILDHIDDSPKVFRTHVKLNEELSLIQQAREIQHIAKDTTVITFISISQLSMAHDQEEGSMIQLPIWSPEEVPRGLEFSNCIALQQWRRCNPVSHLQCQLHHKEDDPSNVY